MPIGKKNCCQKNPVWQPSILPFVTWKDRPSTSFFYPPSPLPPPSDVGEFHCHTPLRVLSSFNCWLQYLKFNFVVKLIQSFDSRWPLPRNNPCIIDLQSNWLVFFATSFRWVVFLSKMVARMEINTMIFHMTCSLTMLAFWFLFSFPISFLCYMIKKSSTDELDWFSITWDMQVLVIFVLS